MFSAITQPNKEILVSSLSPVETFSDNLFRCVFFLSSSVVAMATSSTGIVSENDANDCAVKDF